VPISRRYNAHGIVGALAGLGLLDLGDGLLRDLDKLVVGVVLGVVLFVLAVAVVASVTLMPMSESNRHDVFDLFGEVVSDGSTSFELIEGHEAALLGLLDHLLTAGVRQVEQRRGSVGGILLRGVRCLVVFFLVFHLQRLCLAGHSLLPNRTSRVSRGAPVLIYSNLLHDAERAAHVLSPPRISFAGYAGAAPNFD